MQYELAGRSLSRHSFRQAFSLTLIAAAVALSACGGGSEDNNTTAAPVVATDPAISGAWASGDFHTHTYLTDGNNLQAIVAEKAFKTYGLDWFANSEHGGSSARAPDGSAWPASTVFKGNKDSKGDNVMWRWQSLADYSWPILFDATTGLQKQYSDKVLVQGVEWNVPTHEHASIAFVAQTSPKAVSDFEYRFDASDADTSQAALTKANKTHADAVSAVKYLQDNYAGKAWFMLNHPSRKQLYKVSDLRDFNNAGPDVFMGFEGMPGHQKNPVGRGGYENKPGDAVYDVRARTYGGADYFLAKVGGLWDSLLGEGRKVWIFINSDFHDEKADDFWPGEYDKTYTRVSNKKDQQSILSGMKSGNAFIVHGDLINDLYFVAKTDASNFATMGGELVAAKGKDVDVTIKFKSPAKNNNGDAPKVDHVDLIVGSVTAKCAPTDACYTNETNTSTKVLARFTSKDWTVDAEGYSVIRTKIAALATNQYVRLRGTNLAVNTAGETDADGNPLVDPVDTKATDNVASAKRAFADLWFYSNPIFLTAK